MEEGEEEEEEKERHFLFAQVKKEDWCVFGHKGAKVGTEWENKVKRWSRDQRGS